MSIRSLTGDEHEEGSPLRRIYDAVQASGLLRERQGQDFVADLKSGYFALGHGIHPFRHLSAILRDREARGEISNNTRTLQSCSIGPDDLEKLVSKEKKLSPVAEKIFQELESSGIISELPIGASLYIDPVSGLFQVGGSGAVVTLIRRIRKEYEDRHEAMDTEQAIASRLEIAKMPWRDHEEKVRNTVRWGVVNILEGTVGQSVEVPVGEENP